MRNAATKNIEPRLHAIEAASVDVSRFSVATPSREGIIIVLILRQAASEMLHLSMLAGAAHESRYAFCIACMADEEVI